jgi:hypothetical protein
MSHTIKRLRLLALTGATLFAAGGAALAVSPAALASTPATLTASTLPAPPDCVAPCTKLLQPQQKVVVGAPYYAFHSANVSTTATGFGAQFSVRYSPDGYNYTTIYQTSADTIGFGAVFNKPGYYRVIALNTATYYLITTTVSVNIALS